MKKTIAILLVLVIGMVGVWAANNSTTLLDLTTEVGGIYGLYIGSAASSAGSPSAFFAEATNENTFVNSVTFFNTTEGISTELFVNFMTNKRILTTVTADIALLYSEGGEDYIGYEVAVDGGSTYKLDKETNTTDTVTFYTESETTSGLRYDNNKFTITMNDDEWNIASAGTYTTQWTINLKVE